MGPDHIGRLGASHGREGIFYPVLPPAPPAPLPVPLQGPLSRATSPSRSSVPPCVRGSRGGSSGATGQGLLLSLFPNTESERGPQTYSGLAAAQQVCKEAQVPHGLPVLHHSFHGSRRLVCRPRLKGHILSHCNNPSAQALPQVSRGQCLSTIYGSALWSVSSPKGLHEVHGSRGSLPVQAGDSGISLPGRLAHQGQDQGAGGGSGGLYQADLPRARPLTQRGQVHTISNPKNRIHRGSSGLDTRQGIAPRGQIPDYVQHYPRPPTLPDHHSKKLPQITRAHGGMYLRGETRQTQTAPTPVLVGRGLSASQGLPRISGDVTSAGVGLPSMAARPREVRTGVPFLDPEPSLSLVIDASDRGLGAHLGGLRTQGLWSREDLSLHINVRELRAVRLACIAFKSQLAGRCVSVLTDNTPVMFYINKQGGARSSPLCREALALWDFCVKNVIHLTASYLPGTHNGLADALSRSFQGHKWSIRWDIVLSIFRLWGHPQVDLFASTENMKCRQFCFLMGRSPGSLTDAFLLSWADGLFYAFPPDSHVSQSNPQGPQRSCLAHPDSACVAAPALVHVSPAHVYAGAPQVVPATRLDHTGSRSPPSPEPGVTPPYSLDAPWLNPVEMQCSHQVRQVLLGSRKPSTRTTYSAKWKRFSLWATQRGHALPDPPYPGLFTISQTPGTDSLFGSSTPCCRLSVPPWSGGYFSVCKNACWSLPQGP
nr:uncharacterized protein LOC122173660 [Chrysemys picta bellii]